MEAMQFQSQIHVDSDLTAFKQEISVGSAPRFYDTDAWIWMSFRVDYELVERVEEKMADERRETKPFHSPQHSHQDVFECETCV